MEQENITLVCEQDGKSRGQTEHEVLYLLPPYGLDPASLETIGFFHLFALIEAGSNPMEQRSYSGIHYFFFRRCKFIWAAFGLGVVVVKENPCWSERYCVKFQ